MIGLDGQLLLQAESRADGRTVLAEQAVRSPFHVGKPYWHEPERTLMVQVVNATAGILEGDRLESDIGVGPGAALLVTTPSASRVFRMGEGRADSLQNFTVAGGGWLEVMPEPLVPHRGCSYRQETRISLEEGGELFYADLLVSGRTAHGEAWAWARLCLETEVRLGGELVLRERFEQSGPAMKSLAEWAGSGPAACFGNALLLGPATGALDTALRGVAALHHDGVWVGVSALRRGGWSIKFVAPDTRRLRETLRGIRTTLAAAFPRLGVDARKL
jgi:urease accessory protein